MWTPRPKYSLRVIFSNTVVAILSLSDPSSFLGEVLAIDGMDDELMTEYMVDQPELLGSPLGLFVLPRDSILPWSSGLLWCHKNRSLDQLLRSELISKLVQCSLQIVVLRPIQWRPAPAYLGPIDPNGAARPQQWDAALPGPSRNGKSARNVGHQWPVWEPRPPPHKLGKTAIFLFEVYLSQIPYIESSKDSEGSKLRVAILIRLYNRGFDLEQSFRSSLPVLRLWLGLSGLGPWHGLSGFGPWLGLCGLGPWSLLLDLDLDNLLASLALLHTVEAAGSPHTEVWAVAQSCTDTPFCTFLLYNQIIIAQSYLPSCRAM